MHTNHYEISGGGTNRAGGGGARHYRAIFDICRTKFVNSETSWRYIVRKFYDKLCISQIAHGHESTQAGPDRELPGLSLALSCKHLELR